MLLGNYTDQVCSHGADILEEEMDVKQQKTV